MGIAILSVLPSSFPMEDSAYTVPEAEKLKHSPVEIPTTLHGIRLKLQLTLKSLSRVGIESLKLILRCLVEDLIRNWCPTKLTTVDIFSGCSACLLLQMETFREQSAS